MLCQFNCKTCNDFCKGCKILALKIVKLTIIGALTIVLVPKVITTVVASITIIFHFCKYSTRVVTFIQKWSILNPFSAFIEEILAVQILPLKSHLFGFKKSTIYFIALFLPIFFNELKFY